jgi:ribosomal protein S24E
MNSKIISENKQELMKRKEIILEINHLKKPTPKAEEVVKVISETTKKEEDLITIKKIKNNYGDNTAKITAHIYDTKDAKTFAERVNKKKIIAAEIKAENEAKNKAKEETAKPAEEVKPVEEETAKPAEEVKEK